VDISVRRHASSSPRASWQRGDSCALACCHVLKSGAGGTGSLPGGGVSPHTIVTCPHASSCLRATVLRCRSMPAAAGRGAWASCGGRRMRRQSLVKFSMPVLEARCTSTAPGSKRVLCSRLAMARGVEVRRTTARRARAPGSTRQCRTPRSGSMWYDGAVLALQGGERGLAACLEV
jgi:hypothetical protein